MHPANSTWQSTTFCGNYTCKLRKRNLDDETPIRAINVTNVNVTVPSKAKSALGEDIFNNSDIKTIDLPVENPINYNLTLDSPELAVLKSLLPSEQTDLSKLNLQERLKHHQLGPEDGDRYLTEEEIKTISDLLHNVKKSDLEAIVDIYNLAQDIYKEIDKVTSENIVEEAMKFTNVVNDKPSNKHTSYWYEPSYRLKGAVKVDMEHQGTNIVATTVQPKTTETPNSYFSGPLTKTDFGKLPYYYPLSSFQRQSSYINPTYNPQPPSPTVKPPCKTQANQNIPPPAVPAYYPPATPNNYANPQNYGGVLKKPFVVENQKTIPSANLLPYPFSYVQHYNMSAYPFNVYYDGNLWPRFDVTGNSNQKSFYKAHLSQIPSNAIPATSDKIDSNTKTDLDKRKAESANLLDTLIDKAKIITKNAPKWQTDPISAKVLEEVRAHFEEKVKLLKPLSLRKKVKLERVGKVVKLDELHRDKRSIENGEKIEDQKENEEDDMEPYIEKTT